METKNKTFGEKLKEKYLAKQKQDDPVKFAKYESEAKKLIDTAKKELEKLVDSGKNPIYVINSAKSSSGIVAPNRELESMMADFLFSVIFQDLAEVEGIKIDIQTQPIGLDKNTRQPIVGLILLCTFK